MTVNAIEDDKGEPSGVVRQSLNEWTPDWNQVVESDDEEESQEEKSSAEEWPTDIEELDDIINDKRR